ncbi:MAG TPA: acyl carrier protein [Anaerolineales bacterium]
MLSGVVCSTNHKNHRSLLRQTLTPEIMQTIASYIAVQILKQPNRAIRPEEPLLSSGLVDSFNLVDLSLFIEKTFNVLIDDTELNPQTFDNLVQLTALIETRL